MRKHVLAGDPVALTLACALLIVAFGKLALAVLSPAPPTAAHLGALPADSITRILLVDRAPERGAGTGGHGSDPGVEIRRVSWAAAVQGDGNPDDVSLAKLVRAYGYSELPLLLTLDGEGRVLRVRHP